MPLGYSFSPGADQAQQTKTGPGAPSFGSQGAIKTLNFSLPKVTGAAGGGLSPLTGETRRGPGISSAVLDSVLRTVLGPDHASMVMSHGGGGSTDTGGDSLSAILASLGGGQGPSAQAPTIHPGGDPNNQRGPGLDSTQVDTTGAQPFDRTAQQGPPRMASLGTTDTYAGWAGNEGAGSAPNFTGGTPNWRQDKYAQF